MRKIRSGEGGVVDAGSMMNPEMGWVAQAQHPTEQTRHISVHSTEAGAQRRLALVAESWGVTLDKLDCSIAHRPIEP